MVERWQEAIAAFFLVLFGWLPLGSDSDLVAPTSVQTPTSTIAVVAQVIDGDTIDLESGERVRFLGVDTPERGECYYSEATTFVQNWLAGETVRLERDERERDSYERLLRYVFIARTPDGVATSSELLVNDVLLRQGYAEYLPIGPDRRYRLQFRASWEAARAAQRGRWGVCR